MGGLRRALLLALGEHAYGAAHLHLDPRFALDTRAGVRHLTHARVGGCVQPPSVAADQGRGHLSGKGGEGREGAEMK